MGLLGVAEWVVGGLTANRGIQMYVFAWATTTAGLWFLFEKAEKALTKESREAVARGILGRRIPETLASLPEQFTFLFDRVFGEKHLTFRCFARSSLASVVAVGVVLALWVAKRSPVVPTRGLSIGHSDSRPRPGTHDRRGLA